MNQLIALIDGISTIGFAVAFFVALRIPRRSANTPSKLFLSLSIATFVFKGFSNVLEHAGITDKLDFYGNHTEILFIPLFMFFWYSFSSWQTQEKLKDTENRYMEVFQSASDAILLWGLDDEGMPVRLIDANNRASEMLGYTKEELLAMTPKDFVDPEYRPRMAPIVKEIQTKGWSTYEMLHMRKDGRRLPVEVNSHSFYLGGEKVTLSVVRDITERKENEEALKKANEELDLRVRERAAELKESEERYRTLVETAPYGIQIANRDGLIIFSNRVHHEIQGFEIGEIVGKKYIWDFIASDSVRSATKEFYAMLMKKHPEPEVVFNKDKTKDGRRIDTQINWNYTRDGDGEVTGTYAIISDITERKEAESRLRESEARFRGAFENAAVGASMASLKGRFIKVNRFLCDMLGYSEEELLSRTFSDVTHPDDVHIGLDAAKKLVSGETDYTMFEKRYVRKDGKLIHVVISPTVIRDGDGNPVHFFALFQDVTERKEAEIRLRESEDRFRTIFEQATDGIMIADLEERRQIEANRAMCAMLGYTRDELLSLHVEDVHPKEDLPRIMDLFERQVRGEISLAPDIPMLRKDGTVIYADVNSRRITLNGRNCIAGYFRDITERKQAVEALRERERKLAESQRIAHIGSWEHNLTTNTVVWSDELFRVLGLDPRKDPADFNMFFNMIHPDDQPALKRAIEETLQTGKHFSVEYRFILRDGSTRILHAQAELITDAIGTQKILSGTGQDITERKEVETKIREALKEKEVLLQEVNHRVKNNLAIISSLMRLQARSVNDSKTARALFDSQNRINSMALVHECLYEAKNFVDISFEEYVRRLVDNLIRSLSDMDIKTTIDVDDARMGMDDIIPLGLMLNELITNSAKHAFERIETPEIRISFARTEEEARIIYEDNGQGIPRETDIYNTASLGLQIISMLAKQIKGTVDLEDASRKRFDITFPFTET